MKKHIKKHPSIILNAAIAALGIITSVYGFSLNHLLETVTCILISFLSLWVLIQGMREGMRDDKEAIKREIETSQAIAKAGPAEGWTRGEAENYIKKFVKQASDTDL